MVNGVLTLRICSLFSSLSGLLEVAHQPGLDDLALVAHGAEIQRVGEAGGENLSLADGLAVFLRELVPAPEGFLEGFVFSQLSPQSEPQPGNAPTTD